MRGADQLMVTLEKLGIKVIFSLSGNQIMPIYDAAIDRKVDIIHTRHEAGAVYMADGFARASREIGVALVTAGPGLTNALGPVFAVTKTETPLLLLSGDSPVALDGLMPFQWLHQSDITKKLVKESWRANYADRLGQDVAWAVKLALNGRPGVTHVALPQDVLTAPAEGIEFDADMLKPEPMKLTTADLSAIMNILESAETPLIIVGPSLHETQAPGAAKKLQESLNIPVVCMQSPRGLDDPSAGEIKKILKKADTILLIDKDIDFTIASGDPEQVAASKFILVTAQAESIAHASSTVSGRLKWGCVADPLAAIESIINFVDTEAKKRSKKWLNLVTRSLARRPKPPRHYADRLNAHQIAETIHAVMAKQDPLYIIDGGEMGQWAQSVLPPEISLINGISGAIGGAIPQAIGAAIARPDRHVVAITGDGAAGFCISEIETARRLGLNITIVIGNDQRWGTEVEMQKRNYGAKRLYACGLDDKTLYHKIAEAFGAQGIMVGNQQRLQAALKKSLKTQKPTVINAIMKGLPAPSF